MHVTRNRFSICATILTALAIIFGGCFHAFAQGHSNEPLLREGTPTASELAVNTMTRTTEIPDGETHEGDLSVSNTAVEIAGTLRGSLLAINSHVTLNKGAIVTGDVIMVGSAFLDREEGAKIQGKISRFEAPANEQSATVAEAPAASVPPAEPEAPEQTPPPPARHHHFTYGNWVEGQLFGIICGLLLTLFVLVVAPRACSMTVAAIDYEPVRCLVVGLLGLAGIALFSAINGFLFYTVVWIPFGIVLFGLELILWIYAWLLGVAFIGGWLSRKLNWGVPGFFGRAALGLVALSLLNCIPGINAGSVSVELIAVVLGIGGLLITGCGKDLQWLTKRLSRARRGFDDF